LATRFPLVLTCAKPTLFCQSQQRALPSLRKRARDPEIDLHPDTAAARGIRAGSWVSVETPAGGMRARARFNDQLDPRVVVGEHGWWQACGELGAAGYDPFSRDGANFNLTGRRDHPRSGQRHAGASGQSLRDPTGAGTPERMAVTC